MSHDVFRVFPTLALTWPQSRGTIHRELAGGDSGERQCLTGCYTANIACNTLRTSIRVASGKIPRRLTNRSLSTALSWPATTWPLCRQIGKVYETDKHAHSSSSKRVVVISSIRPSAVASGCRFCPACPLVQRWSDCQHTRCSLNFNFIRQPRDLQQRLGETDPSGVTDFDQLCPHHDRLTEGWISSSHARGFCPSPPLRLTLAITIPQKLRSLNSFLERLV
jgi:hypothetical protein